MDWWLYRRPDHDWARPYLKTTDQDVWCECHRCGLKWIARKGLSIPPCTGGLMWNADILWGLRFVAAQLTTTAFAYVMLRVWRIL